MTLRISHSTRGSHRDTQYIATCQIYNTTDNPIKFYMGEYNVTLAQLADKAWWIIANRADEANIVTDIGPYDTVEQAAVMMRLLANIK